MTTNLTGRQVHDVEKIPFRMRVGRWNVRQFSFPSRVLLAVTLEVPSFALSVMEVLFFLLLFSMLLLVGILGFGGSTGRLRLRTEYDGLVGQRRRLGFISVHGIGLGLGRTV